MLLIPQNALKSQNTVEQYVAKHDSIAISLMREYEIPASLILCIAIHESNAGRSEQAKKYHNHFGMKGKPYIGGKHGKYRKFESDEDSYLAFVKMILKRKYYEKLKGETDNAKWLKAMKLAGYAMDPLWEAKNMKIIKKYNLDKFNEDSIPNDLTE